MVRTRTPDELRSVGTGRRASRLSALAALGEAPNVSLAGLKPYTTVTQTVKMRRPRSSVMLLEARKNPLEQL